MNDKINIKINILVNTNLYNIDVIISITIRVYKIILLNVKSQHWYYLTFNWSLLISVKYRKKSTQKLKILKKIRTYQNKQR